MKMRTLGQEHVILLLTKDGQWHKRQDFNYQGIFCFSAQSLARLLMHGLIERSSYDTKDKKAQYRITEFGLRALQQLEQVQPFDMTQDISSLSPWCKVPNRGYRYVTVECNDDERWIQHFKTHRW